MDKNEDYNFESLSGATNFDEVIVTPHCNRKRFSKCVYIRAAELFKATSN